MIRQENAIANILKSARTVQCTRINLDAALNRVLAEDIVSDTDMPPFNKSAVDGFAYRTDDNNSRLEIIETIPAGQSPKMRIEPGQCSKIMTGAPVPEGADCVIMIEDTEITGNYIKILHPPDKNNICDLGEDIRKGDQLLQNGTQLMPQHISLLAAAGQIKPKVYEQPLVAVIISGDEIVEPHIKPENSKIRNSNGYQLLSQLVRTDCRVDYKGIVPDRIDELKHAIKYSFEESRILIITGGASKGEFDLVPDVMRELGFRIHFKEVAIQPGKPFSFSTRKDLACFGLSGNPVSSFVQFEILVKPYLQAIRRMDTSQSRLKIPLGKEMRRKKAERAYFFPVRISEEGFAMPLEFHGSAHISSLTKAYGIASMPVGIKQLEQGEPVHVRPI